MFSRLIYIVSISFFIVTIPQRICEATSLSVSITIPEEYGTIVQRSLTDSGELIIYIQDDQSNATAQLNVTQIIRTLIYQIETTDQRLKTKDYAFGNASIGQQKSETKATGLQSSVLGLKSRIPFIGVEGAVGEIDLTQFRSFPLPQVRRAVAKRFLKQGIFTGVEVAAIGAESTYIVWGLEDEVLFRRNLDQFQQVSAQQLALRNEIVALEDLLDRLKVKLFNDELRAFDTLATEFERQHRPLSAFLAAVFEVAHENKIDLLAFLAIQQFKEIMQLKQDIHFPSLDREIEQLTDKLVTLYAEQGLPEAQAIPERYKQYRAQEISQTAIVQYLHFHALQRRVALEDYLNLPKAVTYWRKLGLLDRATLRREALVAARDIRLALARNTTEEALLDIGATIVQLKRLLALKATPADVVQFLAAKETYAPKALQVKMQELAQNAAITVRFIQTNTIDALLGTIADFYRSVAEREQVFWNNFRSNMRAADHQVGILIADPYHTARIIAHCQQEAVSYVVIKPAAQKGLATPQRYHTQLKQTPFPPHILHHLRYSNFSARIASILESKHWHRLAQQFRKEIILTVARDRDRAQKFMLTADNLNFVALAQAIMEGNFEYEQHQQRGVTMTDADLYDRIRRTAASYEYVDRMGELVRTRIALFRQTPEQDRAGTRAAIELMQALDTRTGINPKERMDILLRIRGTPFRIGLTPGLDGAHSVGAVIREIIRIVTELGSASGSPLMNIETVVYTPESDFDLVCAQAGEDVARNSNAQLKTIVFADSLEQAASELEVFASVFLKVLDRISAGDFEEGETLFNDCCRVTGGALVFNPNVAKET